MADAKEDGSPATSPDTDRVETVRYISKSMADAELKKIIGEELAVLADDAAMRGQFEPEIVASLDAFKAYLSQSLTIATDDRAWQTRFDALKTEVIDGLAPELYAGASRGIDIYHRAGDAQRSSAQHVAQGADPVNLFDGNFVYTTTDFVLPGAGIDFVMTRAYSQKAVANGMFGFKWDHSYNIWLRRTDDLNVVFRANGALQEVRYVRHTIYGYWFAEFGEAGIIQEQNGQLVWRSPTGEVFSYRDGLAGRPDIALIERIEDRFGNYLAFGYDGRSLSVVEVNSPERTVRFVSDGEDRIVRITDYSGRSWRYRYDDMGDLASVTTPATDVYPAGLSTCYEYSSFEHAALALQHNLLRIIDASGQCYLENEYGVDTNLVSFNRVIRQRQGGGETFYEYADVVEEFLFPYAAHQQPAHETIETSRNGLQVRYLFNRYGNVVMCEGYMRIDGAPRLVSTHFRYNRDGNLVGVLGPEGSVTQFLHGREYFERKHAVGEDHSPAEDANLTPAQRQGFNRLLASVRRGRRYSAVDLNLAKGLWSPDLLPDIYDVNAEDVIQKFSYEEECGQPLTVSDPRFTASPDPDVPEDSEYSRHLTTYKYKALSGTSKLVLESIESPAATAPDGTVIGAAVTTFSDYDSRGRVTQLTDPAGLTSNVTYVTAGTADGLPRMLSLDPAGLDIQVSVNRDALGRIIKTFEPRAVEFQDGRGVSETSYNALDQVVRHTTTLPFGVTTTLRYNRTGNLQEVIREVKDSSNVAIEALQQKTQFDYDESFRLVKVIEGDAGDRLRRFWKTVFDGANRPALSISPAGRLSKVLYNERGLPAREIADHGGLGVSIRKYYDAENRVVRIVDHRGGTHRLRYDGLGRIVEVTNPEGHIACASYDKRGNTLTERFFERIGPARFILRARCEFHYDEQGRLLRQGHNLFSDNTEEVAEPSDSNLITGPGRLIETKLFYDRGGRLVRVVSPGDRVFAQEFDVLGRVVREIDPLGNETSYRYDAASNPVRIDRMEITRDGGGATVSRRFFAGRHVYDELNRAVESVDALGTTTRYAYDSRGLVTRVINALNHATERDYDVFGRLTTERHFLEGPTPGEVTPVSIAYRYDADDLLVGQTDPLGRETVFARNSLGTLASTILPDGSRDAASYDASGMLKAYRDRNGLRHLFARDSMGRVIEQRIDPIELDPGVVVEGATFARYAFDSLGRLAVMENDFARCEYVNNSLGWMEQEVFRTKPFTNGLVTQPMTTRREYGDSGALSDLVYPSGRHVRFDRDPLDRLVSVVQVIQGVGFPGNPASPASYTIATMEYEGLQRRSMSRRNGLTTRFQYDFGGRSVGVEHAVSGAPLLQLQFLYDAVGNMRLKREHADEVQLTRTYEFDPLQRLSHMAQAEQSVLANLDAIAPHDAPVPPVIPDGQQVIDALIAPVSQVRTRYELDLSGNRTKVIDGGVETVLQTNELDQYVDVDGIALRYDTNGNLLDDGQIEYRYDYRNQLVSARRKSDGALLVTFAYDAAGRRIGETSGGRTRQWVHFSINPLEEYEDGQLRSSNILDIGVDSYLQMCSGGRNLYPAVDLVRSTRVVLDDAQKHAVFLYDEFGLATALSGSISDDQFLFQGKRWLPQIGKYDFFTRLYDPALGRFQQRDAKGYVDGPNLYTFAGNNPLSTVDPYGTESRPESAAQNAIQGFRAANTPLDVQGRPLKGPYNLWSHDPIGLNKAKAAPGWIMGQTPEHLIAEQAQLNHPNNATRTIPPKDWDDIWGVPSRSIAKRAVMAGKPIASFGLDTHPNPQATMQFQHEIPTVGKWGIPSGGLMKAGGLLDMYTATQVDNPYVKSLGLAGGGAQVIGGTLYMGGAATMSTSMMAAGTGIVRYAGGPTTILLSGYGLYHDIRNKDVVNGVGNGAGVMTGIFVTAGSTFGAVAFGSFAGGYGLGRYIDRKTGWSPSLTNRALRHRDMYSDLGLNDTAATILGAPSTIPIVSEVGQGIGWGAFKLYQGGSYVAGGVSDFIESRDWGKTIRPWRWFD